MNEKEQLEKMKEWYEYYKSRYEKAVSLEIDEGSRYYKALKEVECRYVALYFAVDLYEKIPHHLSGDKAEDMIKGYVMSIIKELFIGRVIYNEKGRKEFIPERIMIKKGDAKAIESYQKAEAAAMRLKKIDFTRTDRDQFAEEIREDLFYMVNWFMFAREQIFPVNSKQRAQLIGA